MVSVGYARAYPSGTYIGNVGSGRPTKPRRWYIPGSFQTFGAIRCPRYSLTIIWLKIKHFEKQIVFVDLAANTPLKLVVSYCDYAPISSVLVLRPS